MSTLNTEQPTVAAPDKPGRFWQVFWLTFLVISLGYAGYCFYAPSNDIAWASDFTEAQQLAVESDKPIILFFTGSWCSPCQIMKRQVWADGQVKDTVDAAFIPVTIDVDDKSAAEVLGRYEVVATPTTIITDPAGNVIRQQLGGIGKADFLDLLGQLTPSTGDGS